MPTIRVGNLHTFKNEFTSLGRSANNIYKQLHKRGCRHFLERELPDKSRVIIGYPNIEASKSIVVKLNRDGSTIRKTNELSEILSIFADRTRVITKTYSDAIGNKVKEIIKSLRFDSNGKLFNKQIHTQTNKYISHYEYDKFGGRHTQCNRIIDNVQESFSKVATDGSGNLSLYTKTTDGTKTFNRFIGGVEYSFTTKK